jgi:hypothetical protein
VMKGRVVFSAQSDHCSPEITQPVCLLAPGDRLRRREMLQVVFRRVATPEASNFIQKLAKLDISALYIRRTFPLEGILSHCPTCRLPR